MYLLLLQQTNNRLLRTTGDQNSILGCASRKLLHYVYTNKKRKNGIAKPEN